MEIAVPNMRRFLNFIIISSTCKYRIKNAKTVFFKQKPVHDGRNYVANYYYCIDEGKH